MADLADYAEERTLNYYLNTTAPQPSQPSSSTVHLHTGAPGDDGSANEVDGSSWDDYNPASVNVDGATDPFWTPAAASGGGHQAENSDVVEFTAGATVTGADVEVSHITLRDEGGNVIGVGELPETKIVQDGDPVRFPAGALTFSLD